MTRRIVAGPYSSKDIEPPEDGDFWFLIVANGDIIDEEVLFSTMDEALIFKDLLENGEESKYYD
jgi:hypothetical protein